MNQEVEIQDFENSSIDSTLELDNFDSSYKPVANAPHIEDETIIDNIPDYVLKKNIIDRHKMLQQALLTPELIKLFDVICNHIFIKQENDFNFLDYLLSLNSSSVSKDLLRKSFYEMVNLLSAKTVDLVKVLKTDQEGHPIEIALLEKKNFDLVTFHKFNDYILKFYNPEYRHHKPILYNLSQIAEQIKIPQKELEDYLCVPLGLGTIRIDTLNDIYQKFHSEKVAFIINLDNADWGEAVIPLYLAPTILEYLSSHIRQYMEDVNNEKVSALIQNKIKENNIEYSSIKRHLFAPDFENNNFGVFIRIFYTIMAQVYNKNFGASNKAIKETEAYVIISLIARQLILNTKIIEKSKSKTEENDFNLVAVKTLLSRSKELDGKVVRPPMTIKIFESCLLEIYPEMHGDSFQVNKWLETFQELNSGNDTVKEILIMKLGGVNCYIHRTCIIPLFVDLLKLEEKKIKNTIEEAKNIFNSLPNNKEEWDDFIKKETSPFFMAIHDCLMSCFMTVKPSTFAKSQTEYWLSRFFMNSDEISKYHLSKTDLDIPNNEKRKILKDTVNLLINNNDTFYTLPQILDVSYENFADRDPPILNLILNALKYLFSLVWVSPQKLPQNKQLSSQMKGDNKKHHNAQSDSETQEEKNPADNHQFKRQSRVEAMLVIKKLEKKFPELADPNRLREKIDQEHDNWNLKIGKNRQENKKIIDGIINACIVRLDISKIIEENFDAIYETLIRNNPLLKNIKNQKALKQYMFYQIILKKHRQLKNQTGYQTD